MTQSLCSVTFVSWLKLTICSLILLSDRCKYAYGDDGRSLSRGFGDSIEWLRFPDALNRNLNEHKPIFMLIHKSWCGACQSI